MKANKATWAGMSGAALPGYCWFGALQLCRTKLAKLLGPVRARQPCRATAGLGASALPYTKLANTVWALQLCRVTAGLGFGSAKHS